MTPPQNGTGAAGMAATQVLKMHTAPEPAGRAPERAAARGTA
ncbi:hypothetical protein ACVXG8_01065 [Escherichia coli]